MGIDADAAHFLGMAKAVGVDFARTVTLGRQDRFGKVDQLVAAASRFEGVDVAASAAHATGHDTGWLFRGLGAASVDAIDISPYEGASIIADLNDPIDVAHRGHFGCVFNGGLIEHLFDVAQGLENCMHLVAPGGHLISISPASQQVGHGFYQLSPELFYRALCPANGFEVRAVLLQDGGSGGRWFQFDDPAVTGRRVTVSTRGEGSVYVLARRIGEVSLRERPQQSDYQAMWEAGSSPVGPGRRPMGQRLRALVYRRAGMALGPRLRTGRILWGTAGSDPALHRVHLPELARQLVDPPAA